MVWDLLAAHYEHSSVTQDEMQAIRQAAFSFSRRVKSGDEWQVSLGRALAGAVLMWAASPTEENYARIKYASSEYESRRLT
jgi:hypothetical protein